MQFLLSRYGGHGVTIGKGKSSDSLLPEDQSIDYMLDNYAKEIIPNYFFISSYDAKPNWMGGYTWDLFDKKPVKLGTLTHDFNEILLQYEWEAVTDIYIAQHIYPNVLGIFIKTCKNSIIDIVPDYDEYYDYVLQVFIRLKEDTFILKERPKDIERILTILFYKMDLIYEGYIINFSPSKTFLGKMISKEFCNNITTSLVDIDSDIKLAELLQDIK